MWVWRWGCAGRQRRCVRRHFSLLVATMIGIGMVPVGGLIGAVAADQIQHEAPARLWFVPMPQPSISHMQTTWQDHLMTVDILLRQHQPHVAAHYADQLIERRPQAMTAHLTIARLFSRHQQCQPAKSYFRRLRQLFWTGPQRHMLSQIEQACGDLWVASYSMQWRVGYKQALFDAPPTNRLIPEPGSQLDLLCQQLARLCTTQSWMIPTAPARGGHFGQWLLAVAVMRPAWYGHFHQFKITTSATRTSRPDVGDEALALAYEIRRHLSGDKAMAATVRLGSYWPQYGILGQDIDKSWRGFDLQFYSTGKRRRIAAMTGLSIERFTGHGLRLKQVQLSAQKGGRLSPFLDLQIGGVVDRRYRRSRTHYDLDSFGVTLKLALTIRPVAAWHMALLHQYQQRHYARQRFYLVSSHRTHAATTRLRFSTAIGAKDGARLGIEISRYKVRSADRLARRNHHDYALVLSHRF